MSFLQVLASRRPDIKALAEAWDIKALIRLLNHRDPDIQWRAARALGTMGKEATLPLLRAIQNPNLNVIIGAIEALASIKDPCSVDILVQILNFDESTEIRWAAVLALGEIGDKKVIPDLVRALADEKRYIRFGAAKSLERLGWQPANDAEKTYYLSGIQDWDNIKNIGTPAIDPLLTVLRDRHASIRGKVVKLIGDIGGTEGQKACMTALKDPDRVVRWRAVLLSKKCGVSITHMPWGISKRERVGPSAFGAAILNFFFLGIGYDYLGKWWGMLMWETYMMIVVTTFILLQPDLFMIFLVAYPIIALLSLQTYLMAKRESEITG